jgi:hypothetical protein
LQFLLIFFRATKIVNFKRIHKILFFFEEQLLIMHIAVNQHKNHLWLLIISI